MLCTCPVCVDDDIRVVEDHDHGDEDPSEIGEYVVCPVCEGGDSPHEWDAMGSIIVRGELRCDLCTEPVVSVLVEAVNGEVETEQRVSDPARYLPPCALAGRETWWPQYTPELVAVKSRYRTRGSWQEFPEPE